MTVTIRGLTHIYDSDTEPIVALAGLDLDLPDGSVTVVRGPNGSGKSTLVSILSGTLRPSAGTVRTDSGKAMATATISQFRNTIPDVTIAEHAALFSVALPDGSPAAAHATDYAGDVARSVQQHLAAALINVDSTALVLADEPAASLSHDEAVGLYAALAQRCRAAGTTLLLVTHDYRAEAVADRVVRLRDGRISEVWEPGGRERQAIDTRGWLRLPDHIRDRFDDSALVDDNDAVTLASPRPRREASRHEQSVLPFQSQPGITLSDVQIWARAPHITGECRRGQVTHLAGPAGSGTSALLHVIARGSGHICGTLTYHDPGVQETAVLVSSELTLGGRQTLADMQPDSHWVDTLDLDGLLRRPLDTLSGGQRQRALVCIALSQPAGLVAIDEPTVNLDPHWRTACMSALREAAGHGTIIVVATHDDDTINGLDAVISLRPIS